MGRDEQKTPQRRRRKRRHSSLLVVVFFLGYSQQDPLESIVILPIYCRNSPRYTNAARRQCKHTEKSRQSSLSCFLLPLLQVYSLFAYSISKPNCCSHMIIIIIIPSWRRRRRRRSIVRLCVCIPCVLLFRLWCATAGKNPRERRKKRSCRFTTIPNFKKRKRDAHHVVWSIGFAAEAVQ